MLACARLGAVHSVVFGGFSAESLAQRCIDPSAPRAGSPLARPRACPHKPRAPVLHQLPGFHPRGAVRCAMAPAAVSQRTAAGRA